VAWIKKDGVSDADLVRAARDMYEALGRMLRVAEHEDGAGAAAWMYDYAYAARDKARGEG
jgi:hypothetical protein